MRRAEIGHHQLQAISTLAMKCKPSVDFCGYWQRTKRA
jgi:hypothetical protein